MTKQNQKMFVLAAVAALGLSASSAFAQVTDIVVDSKGVVPYVIDARNVVARSGTGLCWRTGFWTPAAAAAAGTAGCACDADVVPKEQCSPAPAPAAAAPKQEVTVKELVDNKIKLLADTLFDFNKDVLRPEGKATLDDLAAQAKQIKLEVILTTGHTDRLGSDAYNQSLSNRRAYAVKNYLVSKGIDASRVYTEGKGKSQPVTGTQCDGIKSRPALINCLQPDRRVEVEVLGTK
ncbi:hypothetical protein FACS1894154_07280 [Betaproteobacteria bacterium]|nr:hypothetical protein FACS1894154_07280 [Betaproteobacteria bacterium]